MTYTSVQLATLYNVQPQTIRNWADEFAEYLSKTGNPGGSRYRIFTVEDAQVFSLVSELKKQRLTYDDIHASLKAGQRGDAPALPPRDLELIASSEREEHYSLQVQLLQGELARVRNELVQAKQDAEKVYELREEKARLETELRLTQEQLETSREEMDSKDVELEKAQKRIEELSRQLGEEYVRGVMDTLERKGDLPRKTE
jgi:DNA-binding transcriptional MerR regulator